MNPQVQFVSMTRANMRTMFNRRRDLHPLTWGLTLKLQHPAALQVKVCANVHAVQILALLIIHWRRLEVVVCAMFIMFKGMVQKHILDTSNRAGMLHFLGSVCALPV